MQKCTFLCVDMDKCVENRPRSFNLWPQKKPSLSVPLGREILVPLELVVSRHYNPIINYKVGRSTMRTIVVVVLGSRDDIFTSISQKMSRNEVTEKNPIGCAASRQSGLNVVA